MSLRPYASRTGYDTPGAERTAIHVTRAVVLPEDAPRVEFPREYAKGNFRVTRMVESIEISRDHLGETVKYGIKVAGPAITTKGVDHASQDGSRTLAQWTKEDPWEVCPEELRPYLLGHRGLAAQAAQSLLAE